MIRTLTRAEAETLEVMQTLPAPILNAIARELNKTEGSIRIQLTKQEDDVVSQRLNPHLQSSFGTMMKVFVVMLALGISMFLPIITSLDNVSAFGGGVVTDQCTKWAVDLNIEGKVRDSIRMHLLGCDDSGTPRHYTETFSTCAYIQRQIALDRGPRPYLVRAVLRQRIRHGADLELYEDGTCSAYAETARSDLPDRY